jgi:hypothetical protein
MTKNPALTIASLIATVSLTALTMTSASQAQVPPPRPPAPVAGAPARPAPPTRAEIEKRMADRRAEHAKDLATILRLTPAQTPALNAFLASQAPPPRGGQVTDRQRDAQARRSMTPQQRLDEQARRATERSAQQTRRADALRTFYGALNPEQKQVFDALNRLRAEGGRGQGRGGRHFGGHRGPGGPGGPGGMMGMRGPRGPGGFAPPPR